MIDIVAEAPGEFWNTLHRARIGENIVYARGRQCSGAHYRDARLAYEKGLVTLVQRREAGSVFAYIAQKIKPRTGR